MKNEKTIKIVLLILFVGFITMLIINLVPRKKEEVNKELKTEATLSLLKYLKYDLNQSDKLESGSITDESMVKAAVSYMRLADEYKDLLVYNEQDYTAMVDVSKINEIVDYMFARKINYSNVSFSYKDGKIDVPIIPTTSDMQIYKYVKTEYNKEEKTYFAYIDVLEINDMSQANELLDETKIEYDSDDVLATLIFKYKEQDGRKILLAFKIQSNY